MIKSVFKTIIPKTLLSFLQTAHIHIKSGVTFNSSSLGRFDMWFPNSSFWFLYPDLTAKNANLYPSALFKLQKYISSEKKLELKILNSSDFGKQNAELTRDLEELFEKYGSDKSTKHDYYLVYADFLDGLGARESLKILEIGLGSNSPNLVSSMGVTGRPGASLRAFKDALPNSEIYGADIDNDILFEEQRIKTAWVDQFNQDSFATMTNSLGENKFDLIIDDGLHAVTANLNSLLFALDSLREKGVFIVEDIPKRSIDSWLPVAPMLSDKYDCGLIKCRSEYLFFLQRKI